MQIQTGPIVAEHTAWSQEHPQLTRVKKHVRYSYMIAASGLWSIQEWLSSDRARGRSPSGLSKLKPRVYTP